MNLKKYNLLINAHDLLKSSNLEERIEILENNV